MVHALIVTRGLLRPEGILVDLRTDRFAAIRTRHDQVFCLTGDRRRYAGPLEITRPLADFRCADRAIREVVRRGLFRHDATEVFEHLAYFDSPAHLERAVAGQRYARLTNPTRRRLRALWRRHPGAQILVISRERMNVLVRT
jgi:hypothetical protein